MANRKNIKTTRRKMTSKYGQKDDDDNDYGQKDDNNGHKDDKNGQEGR